MRSPRWLRFALFFLLFLTGRIALEQQNANESQGGRSPEPEIQTQVAPTAPQPALNNPSTDVIEQQIHAKINTYRANLGLLPLELDYRMTNEARQYSDKMASGAAQFSHDGFEDRIASLEKQALKYETAAENLALLQGYDDLANVVVQGWLESPGHYKNIVGDYNLTGIGVVKNEEGVYYFTQLFLKRI